MAVPDPKILDSPPEQRPRRGAVAVTSMKSRGAVSQPEDRWQTRAAERPFLLEHDILKVTNVDDVPWKFRWDRRQYLVKPGDTGYVPFPAVAMMMGDPRSVDGSMTRFNCEDGTRGVIATRHDVLCTLFAYYGIANEDVAELVDFAPKLEVRTMSDDILVQFPAQNPTMVAWPVPQVTQPGHENSDTRRRMDEMGEENRAMREELAEMRAMIAGRLKPPEGVPDLGEPPDDSLAAALAGATVDTGPATQLH
jgi:hypothetical protein